VINFLIFLTQLANTSYGQYALAPHISQDEYQEKMESCLFPFLRAFVNLVKQLFPDLVFMIPSISCPLSGIFFSCFSLIFLFRRHPFPKFYINREFCM
jgi:hypothetical protein